MGQDATAAPVGAATIDIHVCESCGQQHEGVQLHPYRKQQPPFTHWYGCPETTDPVALTVMVHNGTNVQLHSRIMRDILQAQLHGRMMVLVASIPADGGRQIMHRHCMNYDIHRTKEATDWLHGELQKDQGVLPKPAAPLRPAQNVQLFGKPPTLDMGVQKVDGLSGAIIQPAEAAADFSDGDRQEGDVQEGAAEGTEEGTEEVGGG